MKNNIKNRGAVTVEASIVVPLFLFFLLAMSKIFMVLLAEVHIHQSLAEAAVYTSQYCYLEERLAGEDIVNQAVLIKRFYDYLGDDFYVDSVVRGGVRGIVLRTVPDGERSDVFYAKADYQFHFFIPVIGDFSRKHRVEVKQKKFVGYRKEETETYVYITPNEAVYHVSRSCTHLSLKIHKQNGAGTYPPCRFCGKKVTERDTVYVAEEGVAYHCNRNCSGLKRTVTRVKQEEVQGLPQCSRCGK